MYPNPSRTWSRPGHGMGGDGRRGVTGMMLSRRGNLITLGLNRSGRVIQRDPRVPDVLSRYVDPSPAVIPRETRKAGGEMHIPQTSFYNLLTHIRCRAVSHSAHHSCCHSPSDDQELHQQGWPWRPPQQRLPAGRPLAGLGCGRLAAAVSPKSVQNR